MITTCRFGFVSSYSMPQSIRQVKPMEKSEKPRSDSEVITEASTMRRGFKNSSPISKKRMKYAGWSYGRWIERLTLYLIRQEAVRASCGKRYLLKPQTRPPTRGCARCKRGQNSEEADQGIGQKNSCLENTNRFGKTNYAARFDCKVVAAD